MDANNADMAVVDAFTRLIFSGGGDISAEDQVIVQALRLVDDELAGDSLGEIGGHLASLEVAEMIELVSRVRERLERGLSPGGDSVKVNSGQPLTAR